MLTITYRPYCLNLAMSSSLLIPTFPQIQARLFQSVCVAAQQACLTLALKNYHTTLRIAATCSGSASLSDLLAIIDLPDLILSDPQTGKTLSVTQCETRNHVRLSQKLIISGRVIHGPESGIDLFWTTNSAPTTQITFPHAAFKALPLNETCKGKTLVVHDTLLQTLSTTALPRLIDVVYTWVNDADPVWYAKRQQYHPEKPTGDASDAARFINNNELLYALRGLFRYFHGLGTVYLVTDAQRPLFLDEFGDAVQVIDHRDILPKTSALPTFNSHMIESALHHIPNLRSAYLYSNDDMIMTRSTGVCDFFDSDGRGRMPYSKTTFIPTDAMTPHMIAADVAAMNAREFLALHYDHQITHKFRHTPVPINKDLLTKIEEKHAGIFKRVQQARFRSQQDFALSGSFYQHYALMIGQAVPTALAYNYFSINDHRLAEKLARVSYACDSRRPTVLCINSTTGGKANQFNLMCMRRQMMALLPPQLSTVTHNTLAGRLGHQIAKSILWAVDKTVRRGRENTTLRQE